MFIQLGLLLICLSFISFPVEASECNNCKPGYYCAYNYITWDYFCRKAPKTVPNRCLQDKDCKKEHGEICLGASQDHQG